MSMVVPSTDTSALSSGPVNEQHSFTATYAEIYERPLPGLTITTSKSVQPEGQTFGKGPFHNPAYT
jgi:hypothetical protein